MTSSDSEPDEEFPLTEKQVAENEVENESDSLALGDAMEKAGAGIGSLLYVLAPFLLFCLGIGEIVVLSVVGLMVKCEWGLSSTKVTALQAMIMVGVMFSSLLGSGIINSYGRRTICLYCSVAMVVVGILSGLVKAYWQFMILRFLLGFLVGLSLPAAHAFVGEVTITKFRAQVLALNTTAGGVGASVAAGIAYFVVEPYGWQGLMIAIPIVFSPCVLMYFFLKESPRFDAIMGNWEQAEETINQIARWNNKKANHIKLLREEIPNTTGNSFVKGYKALRSLPTGIRDLMIVIVMAVCGLYQHYSISYATPRILNEGYCSGKNVSMEESCLFDKSVLFEIGVVSLIEPFAVVIAAIFADSLIGRRKTFFISTALYIVLLIALMFCVSHWYLMVMATLARGAATVVGWAYHVYDTEYFPTTVRGFTAGLSVGIGRLGSMAGMAGAQFLYDVDPKVVLGTDIITGGLVGLCVYLLKKELMGVQLEQM